MHASLRTSILTLLILAGCGGQAQSGRTQSDQPSEVAEPALDGHPPSIAADALKASASDQEVKTFYERMGWKGLWSPAASQALDQAIASRANHGLERIQFGKVDNSMSPAALDVARTKAALGYASALANGVADPTKLHDVYTIPHADADVASGLAQALRDNRVAHFLAGLSPQDDEYRRLGEAYVRYSKEAAQPGSDQIADDGAIHVGDRDARLAEIVSQLVANGYVPKDAVPSGGRRDAPQYTQSLAQGIKRLQTDYGIKSDGVIGSEALAVINTRPADKARALAVALERRRWLSRTPPATRIDVNTSAATLAYYRDGKLIDQRRVVVGQPGRETPALRAPLYRLVANPTWTVPKSIEVSAATIRAKNMTRVNGYLVQPSGPDNALGLVKFDMQDDQQIYLHDTSDRSLFDRSQRALSHGCVRVQDAPGFADLIARQEGIVQAWKQARQSGEQTYVDLPQAIPVRLLYQNAFVDGNGEVVFRTDPYGWNDAVAQKLGFGAARTRKAGVNDIDVGP